MKRKDDTPPVNAGIKRTNISKNSNEYDIPDKSISKICKTMGKNIRLERKRRNFSTENLAEYLELSTSYIGLLERGERCPSLKSLLRVCELFSTTPDRLLYDSKPSFSERSRISLAERSKRPMEDKKEAILSLLHKMDEAEMDFVINTIKNLKDFQKNTLMDELGIKLNLDSERET